MSYRLFGLGLQLLITTKDQSPNHLLVLLSYFVVYVNRSQCHDESRVVSLRHTPRRVADRPSHHKGGGLQLDTMFTMCACATWVDFRVGPRLRELTPCCQREPRGGIHATYGPTSSPSLYVCGQRARIQDSSRMK